MDIPALQHLCKERSSQQADQGQGRGCSPTSEAPARLPSTADHPSAWARVARADTRFAPARTQSGRDIPSLPLLCFCRIICLQSQGQLHLISQRPSLHRISPPHKWKHSLGSTLYFTPRYICMRAEMPHERTLLGNSCSVLAPFPRQQHTSLPAQQTSRRCHWLRNWGSCRPVAGALLQVCPICRHRQCLSETGHLGMVARDPGLAGAWPQPAAAPPCPTPTCIYLHGAVTCAPGEPLVPEDSRMFLQSGPVSIINMQL